MSQDKVAKLLELTLGWRLATHVAIIVLIIFGNDQNAIIYF